MKLAKISNASIICNKISEANRFVGLGKSPIGLAGNISVGRMLLIDVDLLGGQKGCYRFGFQRLADKWKEGLDHSLVGLLLSLPDLLLS